MMEAQEPVAAESVIPELQRKLRLIEAEAKSFGDEAQAQIRKQKTAIDKISKENEAIKAELQQVRDLISAQQNTLLGSRMQSLNEQCQILLQDIEEEKKEEANLLQNIALMEKRVQKCREHMGNLGGVYAAEMSNEAIANQKRILENRLDKGLQKCSEAIAHNKKLKEEINSLRKERVTFGQLYKKVEHDLLAKRRAVLDLIKTANQAYAARDEVQQQMAKLKEGEAQERRSFETEWSRLQQFLENLQRRQATRQQAKRLADIQLRRQTTAHEESSHQGPWTGSEETLNLSDESKIEAYQATFAKIQAATGIESVGELIEAFCAAEEHNFSLFSYVNALSDEVETHEAEIHKLRAALQTYSQSQNAVDQKKREEQREIMEQSAVIESRIRMLQMSSQVASEQLHQIMRHTKIMFDEVGGSDIYSDELWVKADVGEQNITNYLQAVEKVVDEMVVALEDSFCTGEKLLPMELRMLSTDKKAEKPAVTSSSRKASPQIKLPSAVNRASSLDTSDEDDQDPKPLSREELRDKLKRNKVRREERRRGNQKRLTAR